MFNNIDKKIKMLTLILFGFSCLLFLILGIVLMTESAAAGILVIFIGVILSWVSSFFTYGFGELITKVSEIAKNTAHGGASPAKEAPAAAPEASTTKESAPKPTASTVKRTISEYLKLLEHLKENQLISDEEYADRNEKLYKDPNNKGAGFKVSLAGLFSILEFLLQHDAISEAEAEERKAEYTKKFSQK